MIVSVTSMFIPTSTFNITALRILRATRLLRMIRASKGLRRLLRAFYNSLSSLINVLLLLGLMLFTFSVASMNLFGTIKNKIYINDDSNFRSFYKATFTLFGIATGEKWTHILDELKEEIGMIAVIFMVIYKQISFIFINIFVGVIYQCYVLSKSDYNEKFLTLRKRDLKYFL